MKRTNEFYRHTIGGSEYFLAIVIKKKGLRE